MPGMNAYHCLRSSPQPVTNTPASSPLSLEVTVACSTPSLRESQQHRAPAPAVVTGLTIPLVFISFSFQPYFPTSLPMFPETASQINYSHLNICFHISSEGTRARTETKAQRGQGAWPRSHQCQSWAYVFVSWLFRPTAHLLPHI